MGVEYKILQQDTPFPGPKHPDPIFDPIALFAWSPYASKAAQHNPPTRTAILIEVASTKVFIVHLLLFYLARRPGESSRLAAHAPVSYPEQI
jgi:hypothetical protein